MPRSFVSKEKRKKIMSDVLGGPEKRFQKMRRKAREKAAAAEEREARAAAEEREAREARAAARASSAAEGVPIEDKTYSVGDAKNAAEKAAAAAEKAAAAAEKAKKEKEIEGDDIILAKIEKLAEEAKELKEEAAKAAKAAKAAMEEGNKEEAEKQAEIAAEAADKAGAVMNKIQIDLRLWERKNPKKQEKSKIESNKNKKKWRFKPFGNLLSFKKNPVAAGDKEEKRMWISNPAFVDPNQAEGVGHKSVFSPNGPWGPKEGENIGGGRKKRRTKRTKRRRTKRTKRRPKRQRRRTKRRRPNKSTKRHTKRRTKRRVKRRTKRRVKRRRTKRTKRTKRRRKR